MQLKDQVAIVTGSATGIGAACAERLAAQGARVVVNCTKSVTDAEATVSRIRAAGGEALLVQANVAEDADCRRMAAAAVETWGRIDILVNNA
ncbi:MAG: SDR family NAD(P)-dependent oxidoreductase, partial [Phycisphaerae bacterium]